MMLELFKLLSLYGRHFCLFGLIDSTIELHIEDKLMKLGILCIDLLVFKLIALKIFLDKPELNLELNKLSLNLIFCIFLIF